MEALGKELEKTNKKTLVTVYGGIARIFLLAFFSELTIFLVYLMAWFLTNDLGYDFRPPTYFLPFIVATFILWFIFQMMLVICYNSNSSEKLPRKD